MAKEAVSTPSEFDDLPRADLPELSASQETTIIVPGGYSDLAKTLLFKAINQLVSSGRAEKINFLFIDLVKSNTEQFRDHVRSVLEATEDNEEATDLSAVYEKIYYAQCPGQTSDSQGYTPENLEALFNGGLAEKVLPNIKQTRWLIHTALRPEHALEFYESIPDDLAELIDWILLEKPIGRDSESAEESIKRIESKESLANKVRAIDHYLAKQMILFLVQLKKKRNNEIPEFKELYKGMETFLDPALWEFVNIIMTEPANLEGRKETFDQIGGILEDMVQSHAIQTIAAVMSVINPNEENAFDKASARFLDSIRSLILTEIGQYMGYTRKEINGEQAYTPNSKTLTAVKGKFRSDSVSYTFEVSKAVSQKKRTMFYIQFKGDGIIFAEGKEDQVLVNQIEFHMSENYVLLVGQELGKDQSKTVKREIANDGLTLDMDAYANLYYSVLTRQMNGTVSLQNIIKAWSLIEELKQSIKKLKIKRYPQGTRFS